MANKLVQTLFRPVKIGDLTLPNKIAMASMTRLRCDPKTDVPNDLLVQYYTQRASAGLLLSEASPISKSSLGVQGAGSLYTPEQVKGWKKVTDAVHKKGGRMFAQLWHGGRSAHQAYSGEQPVSASGLKVRDPVPGGLEYEQPRELSTEEVRQIVEDFGRAAENARQAGFDGVELHGANGYLIDEFLKDATNKRTDAYGGSVEKRCKLALDAVDAMIKVWGKDRVAIKLSPVVRYLDVYDSDPVATFSHLLKQLDQRGIAYVQLVESNPGKSSHYGPGSDQIAHVTKTLRPYFKGPIMINSGLTPESAAQAIESGDAELTSFGRIYTSNPDLVERIKNGWPLENFEPQFFYSGGARGYSDYPSYEEKQKQKN